MAGLVPAIPLGRAPCLRCRDARHKAGHDEWRDRMNAAARPKPLSWDELKHRLDESQPFNMMRGTPYYRDAVYEQFSKQEYARRYAAIRVKMRTAQLDCVIVPGGPSHW